MGPLKCRPRQKSWSAQTGRLPAGMRILRHFPHPAVSTNSWAIPLQHWHATAVTRKLEPTVQSRQRQRTTNQLESGTPRQRPRLIRQTIATQRTRGPATASTSFSDDVTVSTICFPTHQQSLSRHRADTLFPIFGSGCSRLASVHSLARHSHPHECVLWSACFRQNSLRRVAFGQQENRTDF